MSELPLGFPSFGELPFLAVSNCRKKPSTSINTLLKKV